MKRSHRAFVALALSMNALFMSCNDRAQVSKDGAAAPDSAQAGRLAQDTASAWNASIRYDSFVDARNGRSYRAVSIGGQTWMAENLDLRLTGSDSGWCYDGEAANCARYGRLYTWAMAMGRSLRSRSPGRPQGICPDGWFVPSAADWDSLAAFAERDARVGKDKAAEALRAAGLAGFPGKDLFGFRALPAGYRKNDGAFLNIGHETYWPTSDEAFRGTTDKSTYMITSADPSRAYKDYAASLRCIK